MDAAKAHPKTHRAGKKHRKPDHPTKVAAAAATPVENDHADDGDENAQESQAYRRKPKRNLENGKLHVTAPADKISAVARQSRKGGRKKVGGDGDDLIDQFKDRLSGGTFRMLNEQIYTTPSAFAGQLLRDKETYEQYHEGYRRQVAMWPVNPVDVIISALRGDKRGRFLQHKSKHLPGMIPSGWVIADLGCGDAAIARAMKDNATVHSFDFRAANELVTPCDMANLPLPNESVDIAVFSLSLMSTNYLDYVYEAHRILKPNKLLKIAEVRSRLPDPERFAMLIESVGFTLDWWGIIDGYFCVFDFVRREGEPNREPFSSDFNPCTLLTPCLYKRR